MSRVDQGYLLNKLSSLSEFDIGKSKAGTIRNIKEYGEDYLGIRYGKQLESVIEEISGIDNGASEETFTREVSEIVPDIDWEDIEIVKEYPYGAEVAVGMFIKYLQPEIKKEFGEQA